ncbi:hypothetical protein QBC44DRAFT_313786 [Cladorrhinum sp. PSN332]|nr:hypothetical protein QBC44DRAFT_313786 [Cladorrhinum sp. PSN332]
MEPSQRASQPGGQAADDLMQSTKQRLSDAFIYAVMRRDKGANLPRFFRLVEVLLEFMPAGVVSAAERLVLSNLARVATSSSTSPEQRKEIIAHVTGLLNDSRAESEARSEEELTDKQGLSLPSQRRARRNGTATDESDSDERGNNKSDDEDNEDSEDGDPQPRGRKRKRVDTPEPTSKPSKRPRVKAPHSLDEFIEELKARGPPPAQNSPHLSHVIIQSIDITGELEEQQDPKARKAEEEIILASLYLLSQIFGDEGLDRCRSLYKEHYKMFCHNNFASEIERAEKAKADLEELNCPNLSRLMDCWVTMRAEEADKSRTRDLRYLKATLDLVRTWETISSKVGAQGEVDTVLSSELFSNFIKFNGLENAKGVTRRSQLTKFISSQLGISSRKFTKTVSRYKPIAILVRYFGEGILAFLPRAGLLRHFKALQIKYANSQDQCQGEIIFCKIIEKMLDQYPRFKELCGLANDNAIGPITSRHILPHTTGLKLLEEKNDAVFDKTDIWYLISPADRVTEIHDGSDTDRSDPESARGEDDDINAEDSESGYSS